MSELNAKQRRFAEEYLVDLNATQAAIRAGYSEKTAGSQGFDLLRKPEIAAYVSDKQQERGLRTQITADRVLQELGRLAFFDIRKLYNDDGTMKNPSELDDETAAGLAGIDVIEQAVSSTESDERTTEFFSTKKAKTFDKKGALELCMRHLGMLKDKVEHSGPNGQPLPPPVIQPMFNVTLTEEKKP